MNSAQIELLRLLVNKPCEEKYLLSAMNELANKYQNQDFAIDVAESVDFKHANYINFQVAVDPQHSFNFATKSYEKEALTDKGKAVLNLI